MKKIILPIFFASIGLVAWNNLPTTMDSNGINGYTGSSGEGTCNQAGCHNQFTLNTGGGSVTLASSNMPGNQYQPGQTYHMNCTVSKTGAPLFGFTAEALDAGNHNAGMPVVTNSTEMTLHPTSWIPNYPTGRWTIGHKKNGGLSSNTHVFNFDWTAPIVPRGTLTFYAAGNAADNDGTNQGDYIYSTTFSVTPSATPFLISNGSLNAFNALAGTPSPAQAMEVAGYFLSSNATITAPASFEVSSSASSGFASSLNLSPALTDVPLTKFYVRYNPASAGNNSGNLSITSASANTVTVAISGTAANAGSPIINEVGMAAAFGAVVGTPSAAQSFTVSGSNLTANITVTAPAQFQVSLSASSGFTASVSLTQISGNVPATPVYIRYNPASSGNHSGNVSLTSTGAITQNIAVSGSSVASSGQKVIIDGTLNTFTTTVGNPSAAQTFTLSSNGLTLTQFALTLSAPTHFEISLSSSTGYTDSIKIYPPSSGKIPPTPVYVRYNPTAAYTHFDNISIINQLIGAVNVNLVGVSNTSATLAGEISSRKNDLAVYPDPATSVLNFNLQQNNSEMKISVLNISGQAVLEKYSAERSIDVSNLPTGVYFLRVNDKIKKFIKGE